MADTLQLTDYHTAVEQYLKEKLTWLNSVTSYPETETALTTPCAFFQVMDWDKADKQPMNGQLGVVLKCQLIAVLGVDDPAHQLEIRQAAMAVSMAVDGARFGLPVDPAVLVSAQPDAFNPELDAYAAWSIEFNHRIDVGVDEYKPEGLTPTVVRVGYSPDIGDDNADKYEQVVP